MFGKYNGFVSKARVSACMCFLVTNYLADSNELTCAHITMLAMQLPLIICVTD